MNFQNKRAEMLISNPVNELCQEIHFRTQFLAAVKSTKIYFTKIKLYALCRLEGEIEYNHGYFSTATS
jgi:hypothetical protein